MYGREGTELMMSVTRDTSCTSDVSALSASDFTGITSASTHRSSIRLNSTTSAAAKLNLMSVIQEWVSYFVLREHSSILYTININCIFHKYPWIQPWADLAKNNNTCKGLYPYLVSWKSIKQFWRKSQKRKCKKFTPDHGQTTRYDKNSPEHSVSVRKNWSIQFQKNYPLYNSFKIWYYYFWCKSERKPEHTCTGLQHICYTAV